MTTELRSYHETIKAALQHTTIMTTWLRMREKPGIKASYSSFYRYVRKHLPELIEQHTITVRREDPPPGEESQLDYGYLGLWTDPLKRQESPCLGFCQHIILQPAHLCPGSIPYGSSNLDRKSCGQF